MSDYRVCNDGRTRRRVENGPIDGSSETRRRCPEWKNRRQGSMFRVGLPTKTRKETDHGDDELSLPYVGIDALPA